MEPRTHTAVIAISHIRVNPCPSVANIFFEILSARHGTKSMEPRTHTAVIAISHIRVNPCPSVANIFFEILSPVTALNQWSHGRTRLESHLSYPCESVFIRGQYF